MHRRPLQAFLLMLSQPTVATLRTVYGQEQESIFAARQVSGTRAIGRVTLRMVLGASSGTMVQSSMVRWNVEDWPKEATRSHLVATLKALLMKTVGFFRAKDLSRMSLNSSRAPGETAN